MKKCAYLILACLTMYSCKKDKECIEKESQFRFLKSEVKSSMPYQDGQIVNFERAGEIYSFVVDSELDTVKDIIWGFCEDCCSDSVFKYEEQLHIELYDSTHHVRFEFDIKGLSQSMFLDVYPFTIGQHSNASSTLYYSLDSEGDFICNYDSVTQNGAVCHDTITIGSTLYHDVAEIRHQWGWFYDTRKVFYSQEKGILKVTFRYDVIDEFILNE